MTETERAELLLDKPSQIEHAEDTTEIVGVREIAEARILLVQRCNSLHVVVRKREVKDVEIGHHALFVH